MEQRAVIKFHAKLGKNASEIFWLMQHVYSDDFLSRANVFLQHKRFLEGRESLEDDNREVRQISTMLITFFDSKRIIHREFVPTGQTITGAYYLQILKRLMAKIRRIRSEYRDPEISLHFQNGNLSRKDVCLMTFRPSKQLQHEH